MLLAAAILGALLIISANSSTPVTRCNDCVNINECSQAVKAINEINIENIAKLRKSICGFDKALRKYKVCCSEFPVHAVKFVNKTESTDNEDGITNHPNLRLLSSECGVTQGIRTVGEEIPIIYEFPWLALVSVRFGDIIRFSCAGTLINERYLLTAAHCIQNRTIAGVRVGDDDISKKMDCHGEGENVQCIPQYQIWFNFFSIGHIVKNHTELTKRSNEGLAICHHDIQVDLTAKDIAVTDAITHPNFVRMPSILNDIALLRLKHPVNFTVSNAGAICLPVFKNLLEMNITDKVGTVAGWGAMRSEFLLKVETPIRSIETCRIHFDRNRREDKHDVLRNMLCAGGTIREACKGDAGGPLMLTASYNGSRTIVQYGILSYGKNCRLDVPEVFTDVRKYIKWILDTIKP